METKQTEWNGIFSLFNDATLTCEYWDNSPNSVIDAGDVEKITTYYEGEITLDNDEVRIAYNESDQSALAGSLSMITFKLSEPKEVVITRTGFLSTVMLFSEGRRTVSAYETEIMPFELGIYAHRVDNRIAECGVLELLYIVEIKGAAAQKTEMRLEIKKL